MQSDEPITLSDSAFYNHRDMCRDVFLFIRKITSVDFHEIRQ